MGREGGYLGIMVMRRGATAFLGFEICKLRALSVTFLGERFFEKTFLGVE